MSAEGALQTVRKPRFKQRIGTAAAEYAVCADTVFLLVGLAHLAVNELGCSALGGDFLALSHFFTAIDNVCPCTAVLCKRNVEERYVVDGISAVECGQSFDFGCVPVDLALMDVVVFPCDSEIVAVGVTVAVEGHYGLIDRTVAVLYDYHIVAEAACVVTDIVFFIAESATEQAILEACAFVVVADFVTAVKTVKFSVVVAESKRPVHAESFHHI